MVRRDPWPGWNLLCRLANDLELPDDCILCLIVEAKCFIDHFRGKLPVLRHGIDDLGEGECI